MKYRCPHCKQVINRPSKKQWVKSWCLEVNRIVHIQKSAAKIGRMKSKKKAVASRGNDNRKQLTDRRANNP